jgi:hypothetical protein
VTLKADPYAGQPEPFDLPEFIQRPPGRKPRVSLWYWLIHPWRAFWITRLIHEAWAWRTTTMPQPNGLTWCEYKLAKRAQQSQRAAIARLARRLDRQADRYESLLAESKRKEEAAKSASRESITTKFKVGIYAAGPMTVEGAKKIIERCRRRIADDTARGQTRHQEHLSRTRRYASQVPLGVDVVALASLIGKSLNVTPKSFTYADKIPDTASALGFAVIAALVLWLLSHSAGDAAWHLRSASPGLHDISDVEAHDEPNESDEPSKSRKSDSGEFPGTKPLLYAKLVALLMVSAMAGISVGLRVVHPSDQVNSLGSNAPIIAILVGLAVFIGPWIYVMVRMKSGSLEVRTIDDLTKAIADVDKEFSAKQGAATAAQAQADKAKQAGARNAESGPVSAGAAANTVKQLIAFARAHHREAGKYAIDDGAMDTEPLPLLDDILKMDTTSVNEVRKRFDQT